ncbi:MAG: tripartite tricarboxylate transporter substrate binding protein [Pseudomonadota bacterium]
MRNCNSARIFSGLVLAAGIALAMNTVANADYPEKPITVIYPWAPGDPVDTVLRTLGEQASQELGQPFVINNVQGAGGAKSMTAGATAEPDGYTLLNNWVAPQIGAKLFNPDLPYDNDSYIPIAGVMAIPFTLTVPADHPADDIQGFVSWANEKGTPLNYGVCAPQSVPRLVGEQFMRSAGVAYNPIPFSGGCMGDNITGLANGSLDAAVSVVPATTRFAGQVKHLGLLTDERHALAPDLATAKEQGIELGWGNVALGWGGLVVPKETPDDRVALLQESLGEIIQSDAFATALGDLAPMIKYVPPEDFQELWSRSMVLLEPHVTQLKASN